MWESMLMGLNENQYADLVIPDQEAVRAQTPVTTIPRKSRKQKSRKFTSEDTD